MNNLSIDDLLAQATCAVLFDGQIVGTAWLVSNDGHLLTAGHVLCRDPNCCDEVYDVVEVQFGDKVSRPAHKVHWEFQRERGIDFAVLRVSDMPSNRQPLPVSLTRSVTGAFKLYGYGVSLKVQTGGKGSFVGLHDPENNRLFRFHSTELSEAGFSGGAIYSEQIGAVVGIQTEAGASRLGTTRDTVLAMPLYRMAELWKPFLNYAQKNLVGADQLSGDVYQPVFNRITRDSKAGITKHIRVREFRSLVNERTKRFVGRQFIFKAIDKALRDPDFSSGYIVIRGEPGIGKTALMAELVKQRGYIHHFNIALQNIRFAKDFLGNVCAQLIARYNLPYYKLQPAATQDSGFLQRLLDEVCESTPAQPIVILVDALDEADDSGLPTGANRLYLPQTLPEGVFFVVTSREQHDYRLNIDHRRDIYLQDSDPRNDKDVRMYVNQFVQEHHHQMGAKIQQWQVNEQQFVETLAVRSEGNFMYLVYVLNDIRSGKIKPEDIDNIHNLPKGLRAYYQRHWRTMKGHDPQRFEHDYEPVLCLLATVREPVSTGQLQEWAKLPSTRIKKVIYEWREFLNEFQEERELLYRIYHASFQDFLKEEVGLTPYNGLIANHTLEKLNNNTTSKPAKTQEIRNYGNYERPKTISSEKSPSFASRLSAIATRFYNSLMGSQTKDSDE